MIGRCPLRYTQALGITILLLLSACAPVSSALPAAAAADLPQPSAIEPATPTAEAVAMEVSPDGAWVAEWGEVMDPHGENRHVWLRVRQPGGGLAWSIIDEHTAEGLGQAVPLPFEWSADGRYLYFTHYGTPDGCAGFVNGSDLWRADLQGGGVVELAPPVGTWLALSPDEGSLAYVAYGQRGLVVRDLASGQEREIALPGTDGASLGQIVWSPDGASLLVMAGFGLCGPQDEWAYSLLRVDLGSGVVTVLIEHDARLWVPEVWQTPDSIVARDRDGRHAVLNPLTGEITEQR